jgi:hypothetical protein
MIIRMNRGWTFSVRQIDNGFSQAGTFKIRLQKSQIYDICPWRHRPRDEINFYNINTRRRTF